jgi:hypothetical protein
VTKSKKAVKAVEPEAPKFTYTVMATRVSDYEAEIEVEATTDAEAIVKAQAILDSDSFSIEWSELPEATEFLSTVTRDAN